LSIEADARGRTTEPAPAEPRVRGYTGRRRTVLVVDDNADNRAVLAGWLAPLGFEVHEASDGESAIAAAARLAPDAALIDLVMPGLDGLAATARIRALPLRRPPRIVAVTANAFEDARRRSLAEGCDAFLTKPVDFEELRAVLGRLLELEWEHADAEPRTAASPVPPAPSLPTARVMELRELARAGDVMALEARVEELARDPLHETSAQQLRAFVARLDLRGIEAWLEQYAGGGGA
jgi:CheY-like chemotaxis protein